MITLLNGILQGVGIGIGLIIVAAGFDIWDRFSSAIETYFRNREPTHYGPP